MKLQRKQIIIGLLVLFFILHRFVYQSTIVATISSFLLYPLLQTHALVVRPIQAWIHKKNDIAFLTNQIESLTAQLQEVQAKNIQLQALQSHEKETQELTEFNKRFENPGIFAQILVKKISDSEQYFLVDKGSRDGIEKDMFVHYKNNVLGKIADVYPWYSKVLLITDAQCKVSVLCSQTLARGIHEGCNDASATVLTFVNHYEEMKIGDLVLSSGEGLIFPQGYALGKVATAEKTDLHYNVTVEPLVDCNKLNYCSIQSKEAIV